MIIKDSDSGFGTRSRGTQVRDVLFDGCRQTPGWSVGYSFALVSLMKFAWKLDRNAKLREKKSPAIKETRLALEKFDNGSLNTLINELKVGYHWRLHGISF